MRGGHTGGGIAAAMRPKCDPRVLLLRWVVLFVTVLCLQILDLQTLTRKQLKLKPPNVDHRRALGQEISIWQCR
jgi:hypothetical protein